MKIFLFLFYILTYIICAKKGKGKGKKPEKKIRRNEEKLENIDVLSISYELTYDDKSVLKAIIKTINDLESDVKFTAYLRADKDKKDYKLKCQNTSETLIECYSGNDHFNLKDQYYLYYNRGENGHYTFDEKDVLEDYKKISLIFKPEMYQDEIMYLDHRKILGLNNRKVIGGGYLYLVPKNKKLLHKPSDGFNDYIDLNNYISHAGLYGEMPDGTLIAFKEAIRRGFHIVDADLQFTKDKVPVICHATDLEKVSDGDGKISSKTLSELEKLDFGSKFDKKYEGEKILTFESLLKLCQINNVIIDLDLAHLDYQKYFEDTDEYAKIIIKTVEKYDMLNSIFFNDGGNPKTILKLKEIKNDIAISISNMNEKENIEKVKNKYKGSKRIIYNMGGLTRGKNIDEDTVKYAKSLKRGIKAAVVDDLKFANKIQKWGVNYITTNKIHPFLIQNEKEIPILLKCTQFDVLADCRLGPEVKLIDNEIYSIYYSENIYNLYEDINDKPIGEFKYLDTKKLDDLFYTVKKFDFDEGYLRLNSSIKIKKGKFLRGFVGPEGYVHHAPECYQYRFRCDGNNKNELDCKIFKNDKDKVKFEGNYSVYSVENYSLWVKPNKTKHPLLNIKFPISKAESKVVYISSLIFIIIASLLLVYAVRKGNSEYRFTEVRMDENAAYATETSKMNK